MDRFQAPSFDWSLEPERLRAAYHKCRFDDSFHRTISKDVIRVLSPQLVSEPHNLIYDEELFYDKLIRPLEEFICGGQNVEDQFEALKTLGQPTKMCHKVLKTGDVLFSCNDCGLDATCVVCIDCFHKSAHKDHNYRMSNTDGGGCCDCGDVEAWKKDPACSDHKTPGQIILKPSDFEDSAKRMKQLKIDRENMIGKISSLPEGFASRYFLVCQAALHYARRMLSWDDFETLPEYLDVSLKFDSDDAEILKLIEKGQSNNYFTVLFNDEVHTYDHVINTLTKVIKCTKMTASIMASSVSREGRSLVFQDQLKSCKQIRDAIATIRDAGQGPLKVEVMHGAILAHQAYALKLIEWVRRMSLICDGFRVLTAFTLLGRSSDDKTLLERVLRSNTFYWKMARIDWNELFVTALLTEYWVKDKFARIITRIYPKLVQSFVNDDHDHSVSVLTMTTQLYTVPSLVCMLIEEENALSIIAQTFIDICRSTKRETGSRDFENRNTWDMHGLKRGFYILSDLKHLLNLEPTKWNDEFRNNVIEAVRTFLGLLNTMQGMDSVRRQVGQHIEYEPEWETGMTLQSRLVGLIALIVKYCSYDEQVLTEVLRETQLKLQSMYKTTKVELFNHTAECIQYDVSTMSVSVHLPLTRFAAALIVELMRKRPCQSTPYDESLVLLANSRDDSEVWLSLSMVDIMELSLRTEVMIAQFRTGMWRRNGYSLVNQIIYFSGPQMRKEMFDRDILVLQECAAMCEANKFLIHILNKFKLIGWVEHDTIRDQVSPKAVNFHSDEDAMTQVMALGEEFLQMMLTIIGERYRMGVGEIEEEDIMKNEIIQLLCIGPYTRSEIAHKLYSSENEIDCVKNVADLKRSSESSTGKYELKPEFYDRFNPFFYHYTRRHQSHALDTQLKRKRTSKESLICCPPPKPVELTQEFRNLNQLLICDITLIIKQKILRRAIDQPEDAVECTSKDPVRFLASDLQLDQCLHLIGLGLHEQERDPINFKYLEAAHKKEIFTLLRNCYTIAKRNKDLVNWLMKKACDICDQVGDEIHGEIRELLKSVLSGCDIIKQDSSKKNSELAAQRRARIEAMMKAQQRSFMDNNQETTQPVVKAPKSIDNPDKSVLCIFCHNEETIGLLNPTMMLLAHVQRSAVLSKNRSERRIPNYALTPSNQLRYLQLTLGSSTPIGSMPEKYSFTSDNSWSFDATFMPADMFFGPHISTCGHVMHYVCWRDHFDSIKKRETSRPNRGTRHVSFELDKKEILCPLCECISNATIPLIPDYTTFTRRPTDGQQSTIFDISQEAVDKSAESLIAFLHALKGTVANSGHVRHLNTGQQNDRDSKYMRLLQPAPINEVLKDLNENEALVLRDFITNIKSEKVSASFCAGTPLLGTIQSLADRIHSLGLDVDKSIMDVDHARIFMMTSWTISYTIQAHERSARFRGVTIFEDLESSKNLCLSSLVRFANSSMMIYQSEMIQSFLMQKLRYLLLSEEHSMSSPCCLDIDAFELFVSIFMTLQKLYAHLRDDAGQNSADPFEFYAWTTKVYNHEYYRNWLHLVLILNLNQVLCTILNDLVGQPQMDAMADDSELDDMADEFESGDMANESQLLRSFIKSVINASGHPCKTTPRVDENFISQVKRALLPFLRSCAIFLYQLSHIQPSGTLMNQSAFHEGQNFAAPNEPIHIDYTKSNTEFDAICHYLNLPNTFSALLRGKEARGLALIWLRHPRVLSLIMSLGSSEPKQQLANELMPLKFIRQPHSVNRLIDLPYDYSELVDRVSNFTCPSIKNEDSRTPTMCLVCGMMLCSQSYCCQRDLNDLASNFRQAAARQSAQSLTEAGRDDQFGASGGVPAASSMAAFNALISNISGTIAAAAAATSSSQSARLFASSGMSQQLVGSCTYHAHECSGGVGVFLRIRNCQILLLSGRSKGCYMPAPYIDDHGETDFGLMRGNPLHLNRQLYERLQSWWMNHSIPEKVSRTLEYSSYASNIHWHLH